MIVLTEKAAARVKSLLEKEKPEGNGFLRLAVKNVGCAGFSYALDFDTKQDPKMDAAFEQHGVKVVVDKKSLIYIRGTTIDFSDSLTQGGFKFRNPIATGSCSCGHSFST